MANEVRGLDSLRAKIAKLPEEAKRLMREANEKNANEFKAKVLSIIPTDEGELAASVEMTSGDTETSFQVAIGGPETPYPLHVEGGHMTKSGTLVPAKPFWNPAKRVTKKRAQSRAARALSKAAKSIAGPTK